MATIEKKVLVRYRSSQGTGSKYVTVKVDESEFKNCSNDSKKQALIIPLVKVQFPKDFKDVNIESIGWG